MPLSTTRYDRDLYTYAPCTNLLQHPQARCNIRIANNTPPRIPPPKIFPNCSILVLTSVLRLLYSRTHIDSRLLPTLPTATETTHPLQITAELFFGNLLFPIPSPPRNLFVVYYMPLAPSTKPKGSVFSSEIFAKFAKFTSNTPTSSVLGVCLSEAIGSRAFRIR